MFVADVDVVVVVCGRQVVEVVGHARIVGVGKVAFVAERAPDVCRGAGAGLQPYLRAAVLCQFACIDGGWVDVFAGAEDEDASARMLCRARSAFGNCSAWRIPRRPWPLSAMVMTRSAVAGSAGGVHWAW